MTTISKFYLLDAATPNTGIMPTGAFISDGTSSADIQGDATGARTVRDTSDVPGTSNPDIDTVITATANTTQQRWGHRRFVSRPLAAHTFLASDGSVWNFSCAMAESNTNHQQIIRCVMYAWRPSTGAVVGTIGSGAISNPASGTIEIAQSTLFAFPNAGTVTMLDGDILVFEIGTVFTQTMSTAYTDTFSYNGTTEASATTCASFITPPTALTLLTPKSLVVPSNGRSHDRYRRIAASYDRW